MTAETAADGIVMAVEHAELPMSAVQFHPESILTVRAAAQSALLLARGCPPHRATPCRPPCSLVAASQSPEHGLRILSNVVESVRKAAEARNGSH